MADQATLTPMGERFTEACFSQDALDPAAIGETEWAQRSIHIVCNEMGTDGCSELILRLSNEGHARTIRVTNGAAIRGQTRPPIFAHDPLFVLITFDPKLLLDEWAAVDATTRGSKRVVLITMDGSLIDLPNPLDRLTRVDASGNRHEEASAAVLAMIDDNTTRERKAS